LPISCSGKAQAEGVELLGPDGLLSQVTKAVLERALAEEMTVETGLAGVHDLLRRTNPDPMKPPRSLTQTIGRSHAKSHWQSD
jgi:hypothetical protein